MVRGGVTRTGYGPRQAMSSLTQTARAFRGLRWLTRESLTV